MTDLLVRLYDLKYDWRFVEEQAQLGITIRKPIGSEKRLIVDWVQTMFSDGWASECDVACSYHPMRCFIATRPNKLIGFACYDSAGLGFFGPIGVEESERGLGTGKALLLACLLDMKLQGYGYAVIGFVGPAEWYQKTVGAIEIPDSSPSIWRDWLYR
jgi:hypothetical protein